MKLNKMSIKNKLSNKDATNSSKKKNIPPTFCKTSITFLLQVSHCEFTFRTLVYKDNNPRKLNKKTKTKNKDY